MRGRVVERASKFGERGGWRAQLLGQGVEGRVVMQGQVEDKVVEQWVKVKVGGV